MSDVVYDKKEQLEQIESGLLEGEQIVAVYDAIGEHHPVAASTAAWAVATAASSSLSAWSWSR